MRGRLRGKTGLLACLLAHLLACLPAAGLVEPQEAMSQYILLPICTCPVVRWCWQCVLCFVSRGYFVSRNCLREVRAATAQKKPIVLVYEAAEDRGARGRIEGHINHTLSVPHPHQAHSQRASPTSITQSACLAHINHTVSVPRPHLSHALSSPPPPLECYLTSRCPSARLAGGGPFEALFREECPDDLQPDVLSCSVDQPLPYLRLPAFQEAVTLRVLSLMLHACTAEPSARPAHGTRHGTRRPKKFPRPPAAARMVTRCSSGSSSDACPDGGAQAAPSPAVSSPAGALAASPAVTAGGGTPPRAAQPHVLQELFTTGSLLTEARALSGQLTLFVSIFNPGAVALADALQHALGDLLQVTHEETALSEPSATIMLLLLNARTFEGDDGSGPLSAQIRTAYMSGVPVVTVHWTDVRFAHFFSVTPQDLGSHALVLKPSGLRDADPRPLLMLNPPDCLMQILVPCAHQSRVPAPCHGLAACA